MCYTCPAQIVDTRDFETLRRFFDGTKEFVQSAFTILGSSYVEKLGEWAEHLWMLATSFHTQDFIHGICGARYPLLWTRATLIDFDWAASYRTNNLMFYLTDNLRTQ